MMERKLALFSGEHQKNFAELPELEPDQCGRAWSFQSGGRGLANGEWTISVFRGDETDVYPLPAAVNKMINTVNQWGKDEAQRAIKVALGIGA
jgi:hypothetical protein